MSSYFNLKKLRRQSKQPDAAESANATATATAATASSAPATSAPATSSPATTSNPPPPTVTTPGDEPAGSPMLDEEDEKFLQRLAAIAQEPEGTPPPLPNRPLVLEQDGEKKVGKDAQEALLDGADKVPLPTSPPEVPSEDTTKSKGKPDGLNRRKSVMSYFSLAQSKFKKDKSSEKDGKDKKITSKDKQKAADDLLSAAQAAKSAEQQEAEKEKRELTQILDELNLSAVNNRVFSFSKESEELFHKFSLVLKDVVNGVPTAYDDLEKLFTDYEGQLKKMYASLPPFLQNLVKSLPAKITATLGPEILAAQAEKPGFDAKQKAAASSGFKGKFKKSAIPSLKSLVSAQGAVATMLRSILQFLKLRFPAVLTGTNVVMSLAVCILLFVFWYCHKRGREVRLEKEGLAAKQAEEANASSTSSLAEDADSIFGDPAKVKANASAAGEAIKAQDDDKPNPPLIISDGKEGKPAPEMRVEDMPSVKDLPDPSAGKA